MTVSASTQIPKTSDPTVFQRQCKILFECVLRDPTVKEFGSSGQRQDGVDLYGRRRDVSLQHWVGVQCKLTIKSRKLTKGTLRAEAEQALQFKPALKEFILVTTADDDVAMDAEAAEFTDEQAKAGRDFTAQVWGWQTLSAHILQHERAISAFSPDAFPHLRAVLSGQETIREQLEHTTADIAAQFTTLKGQLTGLAADVSSLQSVSDGTRVDTIIDHQVDHFRDLISNGKPTTALGLLEKLWSGLASDTDARLRFRIQANIAGCQLRLGRTKEAADTYLFAYKLAPTEPKALPLRLLALVLSGRAHDAVSEGMDAIGGTSDQALLVAHILNAKGQLPAETDPFNFIPSALEHDQSVLLGKLDYLRAHGPQIDWWRLVHEATELYPDNKLFRLYAADAIIDRAVKFVQDNPSQPFPPELRSEVTNAAIELRKSLDLALTTEDAPALLTVTIGSNLVTAYRLLKDFDNAKEIIRLFHTHHISDAVLEEQELLLALETNDDTAAARLLQTAEPSRDATFGKLQLYFRQANWSAIVKLGDEPIVSELKGEDRAYLEAAVLLAKYKLKTEIDVKRAAQSLLATHTDYAIVPILLYQVARDSKDDEWARELFRKGLDRKASLNSATRSMLARTAENQDDSDAIIEILDGFVDLSRPSSDLETLARGFANARVQQRSLAFIKALSPEVLQLPLYARMTGAIRYNAGDLQGALEAFRTAFQGEQNSLPAFLGMIDTLLRLDRKEVVRQELECVSVFSLKGLPIQKMYLSRLLLAFHRERDALQLAYRTAFAHQYDLKVIQAYIGLILLNSGLDIPKAAVVQADDWVEIVREGAKQSFIIEDPKTPGSADSLSVSDQLAAKLLGRGINEDIVIAPSIGSEQTWKIASFKHKYIALLAKLTSAAATRFPDAVGFHQFEIKEDDLTPILEQTRELSEQMDRIFELYKTQPFPMAVLGALSGKTSVEFAAEIVRRGETIRTCVGNVPERNRAFRNIRALRSSGIVFDAHGAWTAQSLGLLPVLKGFFPRIAMPQSSLDELAQWRTRFEPHGDEPLRTIGFENGEYYRTEISPDRLKSAYDTISRGMELLRNELEVLPAVAPGAAQELEAAILEAASDTLFDAAYIAKCERLLLVSEDIRYRELAFQLFGVEGSWLQPILTMAKDEGVLSMKGYSEAVVGLAASKHGYLSVDRNVLLSIAREDTTPNLEQFAIATSFLGNEHADFGMNYFVAQDFLFKLWGKAPLGGAQQGETMDYPTSYLARCKAAGLVLEQLASLFARTVGLRAGFERLLLDAQRYARATWALEPIRYIQAWMRGHFI